MMNDTFLSTVLQYSEKEKDNYHEPPPARPSSVLFSRPPSSILISRPPSAALLQRPSKNAMKRPPSSSTLRQRPSSGNPLYQRPPSVSTIATIPRPSSSMALKRGSSLKCNICSDGYHFPGTVPCYDNVCASCLEDHIITYKRGTACDCPLCKTGILLPKSNQKSGSTKCNRYDTELHVCNACGGSRLAQYRCNKCEEYFCEKCNKDFLKRMRIDSNFNLTDLVDMSADNLGRTVSPVGNDYESLDSVSLPQILPPGFGLRCQHHDEEELRYHCVDCDISICRDCKILSHEGHETKSLEDVFDERKQHLSQAIKLSNANIRKLHVECSEINSKRLEVDQESRDAITLIENHANEVKKTVDELSKQMIKAIRVQNTECRGTLEKCRDKVKEKVRNLQGMVETATRLLNSDNGIGVVDEAPTLADSLNRADVSLTADKLWRKKLVFEGEEISAATTAKAFGKVITIIEGLTKEDPVVDLEIQSTFNTDQKYKSTTAVAPLSDHTAWVCNGYKNRIQRFDSNGTRLNKEVLDFDVDDMAVGAEDRLYFTEVNGKVVRLFRNKKLTVFARSDVYLRGITLSRDGRNVIVCGNDVPIACLRESNIHKILVLNLLGKLVNEIMVETGSIGVNLYRISHTINDEYVVSTGVSGLYYIVGENGHTKHRYSVSGTADGVACDKHGLIYLSSCKDDMLFLLNCKGVPIPSNYAMHRPTAVSIDHNDVIWVGDWSKIHVMICK